MVAQKNTLLRIGILPFMMVIFLVAKKPAQGWAKLLFKFINIAGFEID